MSTLSKKSKLIQAHRKLQHLLLSAALEEAGAPKIILNSILVTLGIVVSLLVWASLTKIPEVASAPGEIVPRGQIPIVQHLEGGIVAKVLIKDGEQVEAGTPVFLLSPTVTLTELKKLHNRQTALKIDAIRVDAFINDIDLAQADLKQQVPKPEQMKSNDYQKLVLDAVSLLEQQRIAGSREKAILKQQIAKLEHDIVNNKKRKVNLTQRKSNLQKQVDMYQQASKAQSSSKIKLLQAKDRHAEVVSDYLQVEGLVGASQSDLAEAKDRLSNLQATLLEEAYLQKSQINQQLLEVNDSLTAAQDKAERLTVFSPVKGIIKGLDVKAGSVIPPGGVLFEVVPLDETLVVEARVKPEDIGHMEVGDEVKIKVSAFNFARYGQITGALEQISASTFLDENGLPYYKAVIHLDKTFVGKHKDVNRILPGMTVTADIITGSKSLVSYMLKPVQTTLNESFRER